MSEGNAQRRLAAIVAIDVAGYSRLMGADEQGTLTTLKAHRAAITAIVQSHGGRIVGSAGDGLLLEFPSVTEAVLCAVEVQQMAAERNAEVPDERKMLYRIGVNLGDVLVDGDDIYGDGVNVAARLEALADAGGVCISQTVFEQVRDRIDVSFDDLGEIEVKNIARPVRVWRWSQESAEAAADRSEPRPRPDKPSIAVLPFDNMSGDPEQEYFSDGITEDIITELSRSADLFVIARNSVFTYKGRAAKAQDVGRDLGARYIVEGSVRKAGGRVRVTVQLIEAESGNHLWAERFDRELVDIFDLQDELTRAIVGTLPGRLRAPEEFRLQRKPPGDMAAFDYLLAGKIHHHRVTREDNATALELLGKAIELDPRFAQAYAWKACTLGQSMEYGFCEDFEKTDSEAIAAVNKALSLDENDVECHRLLCEVNMERHQLDEAKVHADRALALNPNDPRIVSQQGEILTWQGRPEEGIEWIEQAFRLDPLNANARAHLMGRALYSCRRYADAIDAFRQKTLPLYGHLAELAACYAQADMAPEAQRQASAVLRVRADFTIEKFVQMLSFIRSADQNHLIDGLRKAGLPE